MFRDVMRSTRSESCKQEFLKVQGAEVYSLKLILILFATRDNVEVTKFF